jgi:hypothetical protein
MAHTTEDVTAGPDLHYSDAIAAARTIIALEGNAAALQRRLPSGWELAPYVGDDLHGTSLRGANMLVPFHEVYAVPAHEGQPPAGLPQLSYIAFVSQARNQATGALGHVHWVAYTETRPLCPATTATARSPTSPGRRPAPRSTVRSARRRGSVEVAPPRCVSCLA